MQLISGLFHYRGQIAVGLNDSAQKTWYIPYQKGGAFLCGDRLLLAC